MINHIAVFSFFVPARFGRELSADWQSVQSELQFDSVETSSRLKDFLYLRAGSEDWSEANDFRERSYVCNCSKHISCTWTDGTFRVWLSVPCRQPHVTSAHLKAACSCSCSFWFVWKAFQKAADIRRFMAIWSPAGMNAIHDARATDVNNNRGRFEAQRLKSRI